MNELIQTFNVGVNEVRTAIKDNGDVYFCLTDVASVQERAARTGKIGFSGSNMAEIDEFVRMIKGMLLGIPVCDWYQAYMLIFNRFLCNRIGGKVEDWNRPC